MIKPPLKAAAAWYLLSFVTRLQLTGSEAPDSPRVTVCEVVTDQAVVGDGGNNWGGHQTRIVRTQDGLFTAYTTGGSDPKWPQFTPYDNSPRYWRLLKRIEGDWRVLAQGKAGREPVNLLSGPDGELHIVAWPDGIPCLWSGAPRGDTLSMKRAEIPGPWNVSNWPYNSAGISATGDIALVQSTGEVPGAFIWGYRTASSGQWHIGVTPLAERHCYTYVLPEGDGRLTLTSTRDVPFQSMGYADSSTRHSLGFVFNRVGCWSTADVHSRQLSEITVAESVPTTDYPEAAANGASVDTYRDTKGRLHVLYVFMGAETLGRQHIRHAVIENGKVIKTVQLPDEIEHCLVLSDAPERDRPQFCRLLQDAEGNFYLLGTTAIIPADSEDGTSLGKPVPLDLHGYKVEYSGISIAAPRGGTPRANYVDGVFPTDQGRKVIYFRIQLKGDSG